MANLEKKLEMVQTASLLYVGCVEEDEHYLYLTKAAVLPTRLPGISEIAFAYFSEKARHNLKSCDVPRTAVEMKAYDPQVEAMIHAYDEMSKVASKGAFGKFRINRLKKFLAKQGDGK